MPFTDAQKQARYRVRRQARVDAMPKIACACGCGAMIPPINKAGKAATYVHGHNRGGESTQFKRGQKAWNKGKPAPWNFATHAGKPKSPEAIAKRTATRLERNSGSYTSPEAIQAGLSKRPAAWRDNVKQAVLARDLSGPNNPFYGKRHPPELLAQIAAKHIGPLNANWHGGASTLPYGPEFTRRFKRLIRERDGNQCQACGKSRQENARALDVHHIDHDKMNNDPTNLVTVCNSCNVYFSYHRDESLLAFPRRRMLLT